MRTREWRQKYAKALLDEIESIYNAIPNLRPDQQDWLKKERERLSKLTDRNIKSKATIDLGRSSEFGLEQVKYGLEDLVTRLKEIVNGATLEITNWTLISYELTDRDMFERLATLERDGVVKLPDKSDLGGLRPEDRWTFIPDLVGRAILQNIVVTESTRLEENELKNPPKANLKTK